MTQKFYQLTEREFLKVSELLRDCELRVYLYLCTQLPFGNSQIEIDTAVIAERLGKTRRTVQRALKRLDELKLLDVEITKAKIRRHIDRPATDGSPGRQMDRPSDTQIARATHRSPERHTDRPSDTERKPREDSGSLQIHKTYTDFIKTLSESEREKFLNFVSRSTQNWNPPINDIEDFLAKKTRAGENRWEVYYQKFLSSPEAQSQRPSGREWLAAFHAELEERRQRAEQACQEGQP